MWREFLGIENPQLCIKSVKRKYFAFSPVSTWGHMVVNHVNLNKIQKLPRRQSSQPTFKGWPSRPVKLVRHTWTVHSITPWAEAPVGIPRRRAVEQQHLHLTAFWRRMPPQTPDSVTCWLWHTLPWTTSPATWLLKLLLAVFMGV